MALTLATRPVGVSVTFRDRDGNTSSMQVNYPAGTTSADIALDLAGLEAVLLPLTNAVIIGAVVTYSAVADPDPGQAVEASDVQRKGSFIYKTAAGTTAKLEVPSIKNEKVIDGSNTISPSDLDVVAFNAWILNGLLGGGNAVVTGANIDYTSFVQARKIHRASSKG